MLLKRHYEPDSLRDWLETRDAEIGPKIAGVVKATGMTAPAARKLLNNQYSDANDLPDIEYIEIKHCGDKQNLNQRFIDRGIAEGWLSIGEGRISIKTDGEPLVFNIERVPGRYSCYDGCKLNGEAEAKAHVAAQDGDSPDPAHPAGYCHQLYYQCIREQANG